MYLSILVLVNWDYFYVIFIALSLMAIIIVLLLQENAHRLIRSKQALQLQDLQSQMRENEKLEKIQHSILYSEMMEVSNSFHNFIEINKADLKLIQMKEVSAICWMTMNVYTRVWKQL